MPEGFRDCLSDLVREILREQPFDVIHFAHEYFKSIETGAEDWQYSGKTGRHPIPPPKLSEEKMREMQEQ